MGMLNELLSSLELSLESWNATQQECEDFGDTVGASHCRGVIYGLQMSIDKIKQMTDDELTKMAAGN